MQEQIDNTQSWSVRWRPGRDLTVHGKGLNHVNILRTTERGVASVKYGTFPTQWVDLNVLVLARLGRVVIK